MSINVLMKNQTFLILAAHCFWSEGLINRVLSYNDMYKIGVGKYERNISIIDNDFTQILDASR